VGIHDNFLDLGGHSLLASMIISRVTDAFRVEISLRDFFECPTVARMAEIISQSRENKELAGMLTDLESLSDEEARRLVEDDTKK
jgi:hypothetical protein